MKYKVLKTSPLGKQLMELHDRMKDASTQADKLVKELKGKKYCRSRGGVAGGISAIEFDEKPAGWKIEGEKWRGFYMPKSNNKEMREKIRALPVIGYGEVNKILSFKQQSYGKRDGIYFVNCPGILWRKSYILIEVQEELKYKPVAGMKEITVSEFNKLEKGK